MTPQQEEFLAAFDALTGTDDGANFEGVRVHFDDATRQWFAITQYGSAHAYGDSARGAVVALSKKIAAFANA